MALRNIQLNNISKEDIDSDLEALKANADLARQKANEARQNADIATWFLNEMCELKDNDATYLDDYQRAIEESLYANNELIAALDEQKRTADMFLNAIQNQINAYKNQINAYQNQINAYQNQINADQAAIVNKADEALRGIDKKRRISPFSILPNYDIVEIDTESCLETKILEDLQLQQSATKIWTKKIITAFNNLLKRPSQKDLEVFLNLNKNDGIVAFCWILADLQRNRNIASLRRIVASQRSDSKYEEGEGKDKELMLFLFQTVLASGVNLNEDLIGMTPLFWVILGFETEFLMLALAYGANPFCATSSLNGEPGLPPIKIASKYRPNHFDFIVRMASKPKRALTEPLQISSYTVESKTDDRVSIHFKTNKYPIDIDICSTEKLSHDEFKLVYQRYQDFFQASPTLCGTLDNFFKHEMAGKYKIIQLIYAGELDKKTFIGIILHKLIIDSFYPNRLSHYLSCAYLQDEFRASGLYDPLIFLLPSVMPKLFQDKVIALSLQAISSSAVKIINKLDNFPTKQTPELSEYAEKLFPHVQDVSDSDPNPVLQKSNPGMAWSELPVKPIARNIKPVSLLALNELFFNWQRGIKNPNDIGTSTHRGVFYILFVSDEFIIKFMQSCLSMNLDAGLLINEIAPKIAKLIPELNPRYVEKPVYLPISSLLFSQNRVVASKICIPADKKNNKLLSKL